MDVKEGSCEINNLFTDICYVHGTCGNVRVLINNNSNSYNKENKKEQ